MGIKNIVKAIAEHADDVIAAAVPGSSAAIAAVDSVAKLIDKVRTTANLPADQVAQLEDKHAKLARVFSHADRTAASLGDR